MDNVFKSYYPNPRKGTETLKIDGNHVRCAGRITQIPVRGLKHHS